MACRARFHTQIMNIDKKSAALALNWYTEQSPPPHPFHRESVTRKILGHMLTPDLTSNSASCSCSFSRFWSDSHLHVPWLQAPVAVSWMLLALDCLSVLGSPGHSSAMVLWSMAQAHTLISLDKAPPLAHHPGKFVFCIYSCCCITFALCYPSLSCCSALCDFLAAPWPCRKPGLFSLFRTACWRYLRWLPWCHWKGEEKKIKSIKAVLGNTAILLYCSGNMMCYCAAEVYSEKSNQTTHIHCLSPSFFVRGITN